MKKFQPSPILLHTCWSVSWRVLTAACADAAGVIRHATFARSKPVLDATHRTLQLTVERLFVLLVFAALSHPSAHSWNLTVCPSPVQRAANRFGALVYVCVLVFFRVFLVTFRIACAEWNVCVPIAKMHTKEDDQFVLYGGPDPTDLDRYGSLGEVIVAELKLRPTNIGLVLSTTCQHVYHRVL